MQNGINSIEENRMATSEEIRINTSYASKIIAKYPEGSEAPSEPIIRHKHLRTESYVNKVLEKISPFSSSQELMPPNCRYIKTYQKGIVCVIEEPPAMRSIRVDMDVTREAEALRATGQWTEFGYEKFFEENSQPYTFIVAVPYVIHILYIGSNMTLQRGRVAFRTQPLLGPGDQLYCPPLLNISGNLGVCYGGTVSKGPRTGIAREVDHILKSFWGSTFNPDYIENYNKYENVAGLCNYFTWQYYSQTNPMFIYSADWIPYARRLGDVLQRIEGDDELSQMRFGYKTLSDLFSRPSATGKSIKTKSSRIKRKLLYDICDGWHPEDELCVHVGDAFPFNKAGDLAFIDSYMAVEGSLEPQYVRIVKDDKLSVMKINRKVKAHIAEKVKELRYEAKLELPSKGKKKTYVQAGDIIQMINLLHNKVYKKVHYIRKTADDRLEVRFGSEFYFVDAVDWSKVKKVDISNPEINGMKIDGDTEYYYVPGRYIPPAPFAAVSAVRFKEITAGTNNNLVAQFNGAGAYNKGKNYSFNIGNKSLEVKKLFSKKELQEVPLVYSIGRSVFASRDRMGKLHQAYKNEHFGIMSPGNCSKERPTFLEVQKELLGENGTHFHVESHNLVVDFHIGDKVVVADWGNPLNMLSVKTIQGFKVDNDHQTINFVLEDKHGKLIEENYVEMGSGVIKIGKIRKVTNKIDRVSVGTKIKASVAGISCFPKKDTNIIVAFIIDTGGEPLVLCSNGCTLWYGEMLENFTKITIRSKKWATMEHAPLDPSKIKLQPGDIINGTSSFKCSSGYLVTRNKTNRGIRAVPLQHYADFDDYYSFDARFSKDVILDCIPNPRLSAPKQEEMGALRSFPSFHGLFYTTHQNHSPYNFINESGRIL